MRKGIAYISLCFFVFVAACAKPPAKIRDFKPKSIFPGALLRIDGSGFEKDMRVNFAGGYSANASLATDKYLWVRVPIGAESGRFEIDGTVAAVDLQIRFFEIFEPSAKFDQIQSARDPVSVTPGRTSRNIYCGISSGHLRCWDDLPPRATTRDEFSVTGDWKRLVSGQPFCGLLANGTAACWRLDGQTSSVKAFSSSGWERLGVFYENNEKLLVYAVSKGNGIHVFSGDSTQAIVSGVFDHNIDEISVSPLNTFLKEGTTIWSPPNENVDYGNLLPLAKNASVMFGHLGFPTFVDSKNRLFDIDSINHDSLVPPCCRSIYTGVTFPVAISASAGISRNCAVDTKNTVWCFAGNQTYQYADGTAKKREEPVEVDLPGKVSAIAGDDGVCAARTAGGVICWGGRFFSRPK